MRVPYGLSCNKCNQQYEVWCTYDELQGMIGVEKCQECGGLLKRSYQIGGIKFNGTGWAGGNKMI